jgi:uncharacterized protein (UPF0264 family)
MRLLVSVATADDARTAVEGGADIVDAKDPTAGALGAVSLERFAEIRDAVSGARPLTAALGDAETEEAVARDCRAYAERGAWLVKVGLLGTTAIARASSLLTAAVHAVRNTDTGVVAVAYADGDPGATLRPRAVIDAAARAGARGVLLDTMDKTGPGLLGVMSAPDLKEWIQAGRSAGLLVAVAGRLTGDDVAAVAGLGVDVAGVRGAACPHGRNGSISAELVRSILDSATQPSR